MEAVLRRCGHRTVHYTLAVDPIARRWMVPRCVESLEERVATTALRNFRPQRYGRIEVDGRGDQGP